MFYNLILNIKNFFKFLFIDFGKNPKINAEEFYKKIFNYLYLILFFFFFIFFIFYFLIIYFFNIEINYLNFTYFNFLINSNFNLIFSFFFCHISLYIFSFISDYFKDYKYISFILKISIFFSGLYIYLYYITLENNASFNTFFNILKLFYY